MSDSNSHSSNAMTPHTPGPWHDTNLPRGNDPHIVNEDGRAICRVFRSNPDFEANARLIAAAPEMYEALRDLVGLCQELAECSRPEYIAAWEVLARAEGR